MIKYSRYAAKPYLFGIFWRLLHIIIIRHAKIYKGDNCVMKINIISTCFSALEYIYISAFFRLFGITVYNRLYTIYNNSAFRNNIPTKNNKNDTFNIMISDNYFRFCDDYSKLRSISDIVVSGLNDKLGLADIKFPDKYNTTKDRVSYLFFLQIIIRIIKKFGSKANMYFLNYSNMIDFYLEADLLNNWYLPGHVIKSYAFGYERIKKFKEKEKELSERYSEYPLPSFIYAICRLKYMINKLCVAQKIEPEIEWSDLFTKGLMLPILDQNESRYNFYMGQMYDLSKINNMAAERYYLKCIDEDDYYVRYTLARLCEFRLNDKQRAQNYLEEVVQKNSIYYKGYYKLAMYAEETGDGEKAFSLYEKVINIISERIAADYWQVSDVIYFIKSCGKLKGLRRFGGSEGIANFYEELGKLTVNYIDKNRFFEALTRFLCDDEEDEITLLELIKEDVRQNIHLHIDKFCK